MLPTSPPFKNHHFNSDNTSGVHPSVLNALSRANTGDLPSYGTDEYTQALETKFSEIFEHEVRLFLVMTGTAANALALAQMVDPWGSIVCHEYAHIAEDECSAPEFFAGGAKLRLLSGAAGKYSADSLERMLALNVDGAPHQSPIQAISLSQATESGTIYQPSEIQNIAKIAKKQNVHTHMDGARFANALVRLGCSPADMTWKSGVDVLSFGFTKNGAMALEALIFFDTSLVEGMEYRRKRSGHLLSKHRFLSAQCEAMLTDDLWIKNAEHANSMADYFVEKAGAIKGVDLAYPLGANEVFLSMPDDMAKRLKQAGYEFYRWPVLEQDKAVYRFVCSFDTSKEQIDRLVTTLNS